jgi:nitrate/nitrite-specific signal transduction histidine kinase
VELSYIKDLILRVRDNGKGIEPEVAASGKSGHFGLLGMYERASRVRGKFTIASSPGTGTDVELVVPRSFAFQQPHYARQDRSGQLRRFFRSLLTSRKR